MNAANTDTRVVVDVQQHPSASGGEKPPAASPASLAGADAILAAIADLKGDVSKLASGLEAHKRETAETFAGMADTVEQIVTYVNGASFPPGGAAPPSDGTAAPVEPLRVTVPKATKMAEQARADVAALALKVDAARLELDKQSSLMGIGKRGLEWALSAEGRKQLAILSLAIYGVLHTAGIVK